MNFAVWISEIYTRIKIVQRLFGAIKRFNLRDAIGFISVSFGVGQIIYRYSPLNNFLIYQLLFIPAIVIAFREIKLFLSSIEKYRILTASHSNREAGDYISKLIQSHWVTPGLITISSLYIYTTIKLRYIMINLAGCYAIIMIVLVMLSAILGQTCYVYYLFFLRKISLSDNLKYNFYFPAKTDWVKLIDQIGTRLSNAFFILGFIYTTVYFLNVPSGYIEVSVAPWRCETKTPNDLLFMISWITIFIIIIFAFPLYALIKSKYLKKIVERLKKTSIHEIEMLMSKGNLRRNQDLDRELKYFQIIMNIENSSNRPSDGYRLLPVAATLCSIAVHLIKISESILP